MRSGFRFIAALAALILASGLGSPAGAAKIDPAVPSYVDLSKVLTEYRKSAGFTKFQQQFQGRIRQFGEEMKFLTQIRYATAEEKKEALAILGKQTRTPADQARLAELEKKSDAVDNELATLSQKSGPSDEEVKRIQELTQKRNEALRSLAKEEADRRDQMQRFDQDLLSSVQGELLKLVEKVGKEQKIPVIYNRPAILFGGQDLTDEVLKKLPK
jgi:Skp family chaperone for outer membrane proteins